MSSDARRTGGNRPGARSHGVLPDEAEDVLARVRAVAARLTADPWVDAEDEIGDIVFRLAVMQGRIERSAPGPASGFAEDGDVRAAQRALGAAHAAVLEVLEHLGAD